MNRLHLGIDYGTSASKLVLRHFEAAGGERAYLLEPNDRFRIPSAVSFDGETIRLNSDLQDALKSIKMRFAGDVTGSLRQHFYGELKNLPDRFSSADLVTLTVWRLLSIGHLHAVKIVGSLEFKMGMSLGIPMSFLEDKVLRESYLYVARVAYHMYTNYGPIGSDTVGLTTARELLDEAYFAVGKKPPVPEANVRNWLRSETEASMFWSFRSPATPSSTYFCIDVGAGTTDSCAFLIKDEHIDGQWVKDSIVFFGAHSHPFAMDALSKREKEEGCQQIRNGLVHAAQKAYGRISGNHVSVNQWSDPKLIILGGGAFDVDLCKAMIPHPMTNFRETSLERLDLTVPSDLVRTDGSSARPEDIVFTSVAYGLAQISQAVPAAERPNQVQKVKNHATGSLPNHDEIYGD
ncbi:MAG: hypothetical protein IPI76_00050 [Chloracidobacterium sp.]|nr:hypothetical protein [Chloracidobacterium sp.]